MTTLALDTLQAAKKLKDAGFGESQAEALVAVVSTALEDTVATKADIKEVKGEITQLAAATKADINEVRGEISQLAAATKADINEVKADINALRAKFEADLQSLEQRMTIKLGVMLTIGIGVLLTIDRLLG